MMKTNTAPTSAFFRPATTSRVSRRSAPAAPLPRPWFRRLFRAGEGVFEFGAREWVRSRCRSCCRRSIATAVSLGVARDTGVTEMKQLKGKRVGFVVGSPALNQNSLAMLAFGGLKQSDVKIVEFSSYGAMWKGLINNDTDAAFATTITGPAKEAETSPRGIIWPPLPHNDTAGWERVQKVGPFFTRHVADLRRRNFQGKSRSKWATTPTRSSSCTGRNRPIRSTPSPR